MGRLIFDEQHYVITLETEPNFLKSIRQRRQLPLFEDARTICEWIKILQTPFLIRRSPL
jgi:hypothetical protein